MTTRAAAEATGRGRTVGPAPGPGGGRLRAARRELLRAGMEAVLESGGRVPVSGGCMAPAVPADTVVSLEPCGAGALRPGDVVLLERGGAFFLHRYLGTTGWGAGRRLVVKGDRGRRADAPCPPASVVGRLAEVGEGGWARPYSPTRAARIRAAAEGLFWGHAFPFLREARDAVLGRGRRGAGPAARGLGEGIFLSDIARSEATIIDRGEDAAGGGFVARSAGACTACREGAGRRAPERTVKCAG